MTLRGGHSDHGVVSATGPRYGAAVVLPLHDRNPTTRTPVVTLTLIAVNVLIYIWQRSQGSIGEERFVYEYGFIPCELSHDCPAALGRHDLALGVDQHNAWLTVITSTFVHGSVIHVAGNMLFLWIFGNNIEDRLGAARYLGFYLVCGLLAGLAQFAIDPNSSIPNIGASGAIAGVLGAYLLLFPFAWVLSYIPPIFFLPIPAFLWIGFWIVMQFLSQAQQPETAPGEGGVAYWAHIGGFAAGMVLIKAFGGRRRPPSRAAGTRLASP